MKRDKLFVFLLNFLFTISLAASQDVAENAFTHIYQNGLWGVNTGGGRSGLGSTKENTEFYRQFLQEFLKDHQITSVVDMGCGDWEFSQLIEWEGVDYMGFDIVLPVIEKNTRDFSKPNIRFFHGNAVFLDLPEADLLICKDVFMHLPIQDILQFLPQLKKFKHCLITNDVDRSSLSSHNPDVHQHGQFRQLDPTQPPFNLIGEKLTYITKDNHTTKLIIHIQNENVFEE